MYHKNPQSPSIPFPIHILQDLRTLLTGNAIPHQLHHHLSDCPSSAVLFHLVETAMQQLPPPETSQSFLHYPLPWHFCIPDLLNPLPACSPKYGYPETVAPPTLVPLVAPNLRDSPG